MGNINSLSENVELENNSLILKDFLKEVIQNYDYSKMMSELKDSENKMRLAVKERDERRRKDLMREMSNQGWFPSPIIFWVKIKDDEDIDSYMERCLVSEMNKNNQKLCAKHPHRRIILEEAFKLFEEERYIAAIPLFISQIDGLSEDKNYSPFFSMDPRIDVKNLQNDDPRKIRAQKFPVILKHALDNSIEEIDSKKIEYYEDVILNAASTFIGHRTPKVDLTNKIKILNRNGILHGHKDFLTYGSRSNALKVISLLLFVDHMLSLINCDEESK